MISGVHHLAIKVRDLALAERFYVGVLGLTVLRRWPATDGAVGERSLWLGLDPGGTFLALEVLTPGALNEAEAAVGAATGGPRPERAGHHLVAFRIRREQRAACEARLIAAGVAITHRTAYTIYFHDPEGNLLGLSHHPDSAESG
jgi:glyoxylase I family protein